MRLTTKGRFAVTAMIDLALREQQGAVPLAAISARQKISLSYLEQVFSGLRRAQLVESTRGPGGGYTLARSAADISVADIFLAIDPDSATGQHKSGHDHGSDGHPMTDVLWQKLSVHMLQYMETISLRELVDEQVSNGAEIHTNPAKRISNGFSPRPAPVHTQAPNSVFALGSVWIPKSSS